VKGEKIESRLLMPIGLSYDHRVIDGGQAARFVVDLVEGFQTFKEHDVAFIIFLFLLLFLFLSYEYYLISRQTTYL
jgi:hypothetical protein